MCFQLRASEIRIIRVYSGSTKNLGPGACVTVFVLPVSHIWLLSDHVGLPLRWREGGGRNAFKLVPKATMLPLERPVGPAGASRNQCMKFQTLLMNGRDRADSGIRCGCTLIRPSVPSPSHPSIPDPRTGSSDSWSAASCVS